MTDRSNQLHQLQQKHPRFIYESYSYDAQQGDFRCAFSFRITSNDGNSDLVFHPHVMIHDIDPKRIKMLETQFPNLLSSLVFSLGMIETISYWKTACSPELAVYAGPLSAAQVSWWQKLYENGLGEFYAVNGIERVIPRIVRTAQKSINAPRPAMLVPQNRHLVPIGGGKDSAVVLDMLLKRSSSANAETIAAISLNPTPATRRIVQVASEHYAQPHIPLITASRAIEPLLLQLNAQGYLNGHTPFSAYLAFLTILIATLFDYQHIAVANESSANEPTMVYRGVPVNHQYSKSSDFERRFRAYVKRYLITDINYKSVLRRYRELDIIKRFAGMPWYHNAFLSCNRAQQDGTAWCGQCPKCLFTYIGLSAFLAPQKVEALFKKNLLTDEGLLPLLKQLSHPSHDKPFECIGTKAETREALSLAVASYRSHNMAVPPLLRYEIT